MIYFIKHCVGALATPLVLALLVAVVVGAFRMPGRLRIAGWLRVSATAIVYLGGTGPVGDVLLGTIEREYLPVQDGSLPAVGYIVVLGSGYEPRDGIPIPAALDEGGLVGIIEDAYGLCAASVL